MATIGTLIARTEARLALASGLDVQVIDEPRLLEMLRHKYNTMFDEEWWLDTLTLEAFTTDGITGHITGDVTDKINRFMDINSVFYNQNPNPLPLIKIGQNPIVRRNPAVGPYTTDPTKMFTVYPIDVTATLNVWYRTRLRDDQWEEDNDDVEVVMDDELLILGTVFDYLSDDGSNTEAVTKYEKMFAKRHDQLLKAQFQNPIAKSSDQNGVPLQWTAYGA
jgi:hypothetical protein